MRYRMLQALLVLLIWPTWAQAQVWLLQDLAVPTQFQNRDLGDICTHCVIKGPVMAEVLSTEASEARFLHIGDTVVKELMSGPVSVYRGKTLYRNSGPSQPFLFRQDPNRNPDGGTIFTRTMPDGSYLNALWAYLPRGRKSERILTLFWQYPGSRVHSAELIASEDEERYGPAAVEFSQTRLVMRNDAFGICFETDQKKGKRFVTYWPDSGSFSFSKKAWEAGKPASALEVEAIAPLLR